MLELSQNSDFKRLQEFTLDNEYYDWDMYSTTKELWGKQALDQMIENVLLTEPFERLFNLDFGTPLYSILFENFTSVDQVMPYVFDIIEKWVPIKIDRNQAKIEKDEDNHSFAFQIKYDSNNGMIRNALFARRLRK